MTCWEWNSSLETNHLIKVTLSHIYLETREKTCCSVVDEGIYVSLSLTHTHTSRFIYFFFFFFSVSSYNYYCCTETWWWLFHFTWNNIKKSVFVSFLVHSLNIPRVWEEGNFVLKERRIEEEITNYSPWLRCNSWILNGCCQWN